MNRTRSVNPATGFLLAILCFIPSFPLNAVMTKWVIGPQYKTIYHYCGDYYKCRMADGTARIISAENGKNIKDNTGAEYILGQADSLTYPVNGYALIITPSYSNDSDLKGILDINAGLVYKVAQNNYFVSQGSFFSENLLCVKNKRGKFGYLGTDGTEMIKCQFQQAHPFSEGYASVVQKGYYAMYITRSWDHDHVPLTISFRNGDISFASSFKNGIAVVGYDKDYAYIDKNGTTVRNFTPPSNGIFVDDYDYSISSESQKSIDPARYVDTRKRTTTPNLPEQECTFSAFYNNVAIAQERNGKCGLVKLYPGNLSVRLEETVLAVKLGEKPQAVFVVAGAGVTDNLTFYLVNDNIRRDIALKNGKAIIDILPEREGEGNLMYEIQSEGLVQTKGGCKYELQYPVSFSLDSAPHTLGDCADANDIQNVAARFSNNTAIQKTANVMLSIIPAGDSTAPVSIRRTVNIDSGDSYTISSGITVRYDISATAKLVVWVDGEEVLSSTKEIALKSFY